MFHSTTGELQFHSSPTGRRTSRTSSTGFSTRTRPIAVVGVLAVLALVACLARLAWLSCFTLCQVVLRCALGLTCVDISGVT